jgi:Uma2 family endonuclease
MTMVAPTKQYTPLEVERASESDGKHYELVDGQLKEKLVGAEAIYIALRIALRLNALYDPRDGVALVEAMVYCFPSGRGRKPDVSFFWKRRLPGEAVPKGDLYITPDLAVEVLSPGNSAIEIEEKLDEYLEAGVPFVWMVNPDPRTIRVYRSDGTTRLYRAGDVIENEPLLPGFRLAVADACPAPAGTP